MPDKQTPEETAIWQKRLASQANNRAWALADATVRTEEDDEEMLQASHAAMYLWNIAGNEGNKAHAAQLLAHVCALLKLPDPAKHYLRKSQPYFLDRECEIWELAFAHAVAANVSAAAGESEGHLTHYREAQRLVAALPDREDQDILAKTMSIIPKPTQNSAA